MGYRSYGFFVFPKKYLPELEKRILEKDISWMIEEDAETGERSIKMDNFENVFWKVYSQ